MEPSSATEDPSYLLSFPGCCWIKSSRYFLAKSMNPFIGLLGLSTPVPDELSLLSFLRAGEAGGDKEFCLQELAKAATAMFKGC